MTNMRSMARFIRSLRELALDQTWNKIQPLNELDMLHFTARFLSHLQELFLVVTDYDHIRFHFCTQLGLILKLFNNQYTMALTIRMDMDYKK